MWFFYTVILGMAFGQNLWLMQTASLVGLWGLTLIATLALSAPAPSPQIPRTLRHPVHPSTILRRQVRSRVHAFAGFHARRLRRGLRTRALQATDPHRASSG